MTYQHILIIIGLLIARGTTAQVVLTIGNPDPVAHAAITVYELGSEQASHYLSNEEGQVQIQNNPPFRILVRHLNYQTLADTIRSISNLTIQLANKEKLLDPVVITGQYMPQSARQSVYNVKVLDNERLARQGVQSISNVLAYELNFQFQRDNAVGGSNASLQGISGQNIKVLVDGVPVSGRSGVNNEIDLDQINLNMVDRIEVVEGPMAVNYGADALAGVINIITKSSDAEKWSLDVLLQEETIGSEYKILNQGVHNLSLNGSYKINDHWSLESASRVYRFGGWSGVGRTKLWYPKNQFFQSGLIRFDFPKFNGYYRLDYLNELLENPGLPEQVSDQEDPYAFDKDYLTSRWMHQVQASLRIGSGTMNSAISYTDYDRIKHRYRSFLIPGVPSLTTSDGQDSVAFNTFFFRNTFNNVLAGTIGQMIWQSQLGLEGSFEKANGTTLSDGHKRMSNLALFASLELKFDRLKIRPGIRLHHHNTFRTQPSASMNLKYTIGDRSHIRLSYCRGYRAPSLRELYHEFVDTNHNIIGNQELSPEYSHNVNGDFVHPFKSDNGQFTLGGFFNDISNQITYFSPEDPNQATTYINILNYRTLGWSGILSLNNKALETNTGFLYTGRYHHFSSDAHVLDLPQYIFSPEVTFICTWKITNKLRLAGFYKYTGPARQYVNINDSTGDYEFELRQRDGFHLLDMTLSRDWTTNLKMSIGAKNVFDITSVLNTTNSGGAHAGTANNQTSIGYGRSFLIKVNYHISK